MTTPIAGRPEVGTVAEEVYAELAPLTYNDEPSGWPLLILIGGLARLLQEVADYARDSDSYDGWQILMDVDNCPDKALPWLAQFKGVRIPLGTSPADARTAIHSAAGMQRGTPQALIDATKRWLTGAQQVNLFERFGNDAWRVQITVPQSQIQDQAGALAALNKVKPAGIVLTLSTVTGVDYGTLRDLHNDYADVKAQFATYAVVKTDPSVT
jgi:hypothetical protein